MHASTPWPAGKRSTVVFSPPRPGASIDFPSGAFGGFALFSDVDYYITPNLAVGALVNFRLGRDINSGIGGTFTGGGAGPQLKLLLDSHDHVPYLRVALPFRIFAEPNGRGAWYGLGVLQLGAGYRYWFHRRVGFGADMSVVPTLVLSSAYRSFFFGVQVSSGLELTF